MLQHLTPTASGRHGCQRTVPGVVLPDDRFHIHESARLKAHYRNRARLIHHERRRPRGGGRRRPARVVLVGAVGVLRLSSSTRDFRCVECERCHATHVQEKARSSSYHTQENLFAGGAPRHNAGAAHVYMDLGKSPRCAAVSALCLCNRHIDREHPAQFAGACGRSPGNTGKVEPSSDAGGRGAPACASRFTGRG